MGTVEAGFALSLNVTGGSRTVEITSRVKGDTGSANVAVNDDTAELRNVDGAGFIKASAGFWTAYAGLADSDAATVADRWVVADVRIAPLFVYVSQVRFAASLRTLSGDSYRLGGRSEIGGLAVHRLVSGSGKGTIAVTVDAPRRLVELTADDLGTTSLTYPADEVSVTAPDDPLPYPT